MYSFSKFVSHLVFCSLTLQISLCNICTAQSVTSGSANALKTDFSKFETNKAEILKMESPLGEPVTPSNYKKKLSDTGQDDKANSFKGVLSRVYEREETDFAHFQKILPTGEQMDFTPDLSIPTAATSGEDKEPLKTVLSRSIGKEMTINFDENSDSIISVKIKAGGDAPPPGTVNLPDQYKYLLDIVTEPNAKKGN